MQVVQGKAHNAKELEGPVNERMADFASRGYRALGLAWCDGDGKEDQGGPKWEMLALLPMFDPPRHDTKPTIENCMHQVRQTLSKVNIVR